MEDAVLVRLSIEKWPEKWEGWLWSRERDLNPRPADYESAALPS